MTTQHGKLQTQEPRTQVLDRLPQNETAIEQIENGIAGRVGRRKYEMWFSHAKLRVQDKRLKVTAGSAFAAKWITSHFLNDLREVSSQAVGEPLDVLVEAPHHDNGEQVPDENTSRRSPNQIELKHPRKTNGRKSNKKNVRRDSWRRFDDFVVGPSNQLAYTAATRLANDPNAHCVSPLFIHGDCGVGKTHLLQGICRSFQKANGRMRNVRYVTGEQFTNEYISAIRNHTLDAFRDRVRKLDLLAIDDVHFLANKMRTQTEFLYTLDAIDLSGAKVVLASDNHPHHIKRFNQALVSRFLSGMVVRIEPPDRSTRRELISRLANRRGLKVGNSAIDAIVSNCVGSVRELEGTVTKLAAYHSLLNGGNGSSTHNSNGEIGLTLAEQLLREHRPPQNHIIRISSVLEAVCQRLSVSKQDLMASSRHPRVVIARGLVAYLGRELTSQSFPEIAQALGRVNHSTIHTAYHRVRLQLADDFQVSVRGGTDLQLPLRELVDQLKRQITRSEQHCSD